MEVVMKDGTGAMFSLHRSKVTLQRSERIDRTEFKLLYAHGKKTHVALIVLSPSTTNTLKGAKDWCKVFPWINDLSDRWRRCFSECV